MIVSSFYTGPQYIYMLIVGMSVYKSIIAAQRGSGSGYNLEEVASERNQQVTEEMSRLLEQTQWWTNVLAYRWGLPLPHQSSLQFFTSQSSLFLVKSSPFCLTK